MADYNPTILVKIELTADHYFATRDIYVSDQYYKGTLLEAPSITRELSNVYYGVDASSPITLRFANVDNEVDDTWDEIVAAEEIRGKSVTVQRYDDVSGASFEFHGKITSYRIGDQVELSVEMRDDDILETLLPKHVVTTDEFTDTALDVGQPINIIFGICRNVPLRNIQNNTVDDYYDYLIGYGVIESLNVNLPNGLGVKRDGILVNTDEYTFYDGSQGSPFAGYSFLRFTVQQKNFSSGYHNLTADVKGLELGGASADRNFANVIKAILNNSTWGLNDSVDATTFTQAATDLSTGTWLCDGHVSTQRKARDILGDLLFVAQSYIERGSDGEWEIYVDKTGASSQLTVGDNDGWYNNCEVTSVYSMPTTESIKNLYVQYALTDYARNGDVPFYEISLAVHATFGIDRIYQLPFVRELVTAEKIASYIYNRQLSGDQHLSLRVGWEGRNLSHNDIITVKAPRRGISEKQYRIFRTTKTLTDFQLDCYEYSTDFYASESIADPTEVEDYVNTWPAVTYTPGVIKTNDDPTTEGGLYIDDTAITGYDSGGNKTLEIIYDGADEGYFKIAKDADNYIELDATTGIDISSDTTDAITIKGGGNIRIEGSGDVILETDASDSAALVRFYATNADKYVSMGIDLAGALFGVGPETSGSGELWLGGLPSGSTLAIKYFNKIWAFCVNYLILQMSNPTDQQGGHLEIENDDTTQNHWELNVSNAGESGNSALAQIFGQVDEGNDSFVQVYADNFLPYENMYCGTAGNDWLYGYFDNLYYSTTLGTYSQFYKGDALKELESFDITGQIAEEEFWGDLDHTKLSPELGAETQVIKKLKNKATNEIKKYNPRWKKDPDADQWEEVTEERETLDVNRTVMMLVRAVQQLAQSKADK